MAQTEVETRKLEDYRPNHSLDRIGTSTRRVFTGLGGLALLVVGGVLSFEYFQSNVPQPAYEHAFAEGDENEPMVGDVYYQERKQNDDNSISLAKVIVINKLVVNIGGGQMVIAVVTRQLDENGTPISGTEDTCPLLGLYIAK